MRWPSSAERLLRSPLELLPPGLEVLVEAAWIAVLYRLLAIAAREPPTLDLSALVLLVGAGLVLGRLVRARSRRPVVELPPPLGDAPAVRRLAPRPTAVVLLVGLAAMVGLLGWLAGPGVRAALASGDLAAAAARHPGGWLAGLAVLRGLAHADTLDEEAAATRGLRLGVPVLVGLWLASGLLSAADQAAFRAEAFPDTLVCLVAGLLAIGLAGRRAQARSAGRDPGVAPGSLGLLVVAVGLMVAVAVPLGAALGRPVAEVALAVLRPLLGLILLVLVIRTAPRAVAYAGPWVGLLIVVVVGFRLLGVPPPDLAKMVQDLQRAMQLAPTPESGGDPGSLPSLLALGLLAALGVVVVLLVRAWLGRRVRPPGPDVLDERSVIVESRRLRLPRPSLRRRPGGSEGAPADAVSAYRASLRALAGDPDLRRAPAESPGEHVRRMAEVLAARSPIGPLARLAADYELAVFGRRTLSRREERRALRRWERVREALSSPRARPSPPRTPRRP